MRMIFVSNTGNDSNNGFTESTPWLTLEKVNASCERGDIVHFRSGDAFYGFLDVPAGYKTNRTVLTRYGEGARPIISGYKKVTATASWVDQGSNVWRLDLSDIALYSGNTMFLNYNVGFIKVDGVIYGWKKSTNALSLQWDFYSDATQYLYVYSVGNPNSVATEIMISILKNQVNGGDYLTVTGLDIVGTGAHGINSNQIGLRFTDNHVREIGGSYLSGTTRYGNGIQIWNPSEDAIVTNNVISDCYDTAYTMQGNNLTTTGFVNCVFKYNISYNCPMGFEWWVGGTAVSGQGFNNCVVEDNIFINMSGGWGYDVRPDRSGSAGITFFSTTQPVNDISVRGNIFYNPKIYHYIGIGKTIPTDYVSDYNHIFMTADNILTTMTIDANLCNKYTMSQYQDFITATGLEEHSQFHFIEEYSKNNSIVKILNYICSTVAESSINRNAVNSAMAMVRQLESKVDYLQFTPKTMLYNLGAPVIADVDRVVTVANGMMKNSTYTKTANPDIARNLTLTHATVDTTDTLGIVTIVGTDASGLAITEILTPSADTIVLGVKAFKTVTSITGSGWTQAGATVDTISVGIGNELGVPVSLSATTQMVLGILGLTLTAHNPTVAVTPTISETTVDMSAGTYDGSKSALVFVVV